MDVVANATASLMTARIGIDRICISESRRLLTPNFWVCRFLHDKEPRNEESTNNL